MAGSTLRYLHRNRCLPETKELIKEEFRGDGGVYKIFPIK
jgi:hypothetical protein